jgi:hypothetical protein
MESVDPGRNEWRTENMTVGTGEEPLEKTVCMGGR